MKNKTFSFISAKGGSGKTILIATIADFLSQIGKKVLIIDSDSSTIGLSLFYFDELIAKSNDNQDIKGIFDENYIFSFNNLIELNNGVSFIPATFQFSNTDCVELSVFKSNLLNTINHIKEKEAFDYVLIDCQAGSENHTEVVIQNDISDEIIIVSEYDPISAAGIERIKGLFNKYLTYDRTWVLLNKVLPEFANSNSDFLKISKYLSPILWDVEVVRRYARKEIALDFVYGNDYTLSIIKLLRTLFDKKLKDDLSDWLNQKSDMIKKPLYEEYLKVKQQLADYNKKRQSSLAFLKLNLFLIIIIILGLLATMTFLDHDTGIINDIIIKIGTINSVIYVISFSLVVFSSFNLYYYFRKSKFDRLENKFEIEQLEKKASELEVLKHADIENILRYNKHLEIFDFE